LDLIKKWRLIQNPGEFHEILNSWLSKTDKPILNKEFDLDPAMFGLPLFEGLGVFLKGEIKNFLFMHPGSNLPGLNCWLIGWHENGSAIIIMTNGAMGEILSMEIISCFIREYNN